MTGKWMAHSKGCPGDSSFEIAVIRENNTHGLRSFGWFDEDKLLISESGGPWSVTDHVWGELMEVARRVADFMNGETQ